MENRKTIIAPSQSFPAFSSQHMLTILLLSVVRHTSRWHTASVVRLSDHVASVVGSGKKTALPQLAEYSGDFVYPKPRNSPLPFRQ